ncbi:MAG TPA: hypothetical protein VFI22_07725, partial [Thermomicrobiales bacterium]|nr:hypothetical protein [Thermomicrobiales bacterium]
RFWGTKDQPVVSAIEVYESPKPGKGGKGGKNAAESPAAPVADLDRRGPFQRRARRARRV